MLFGIGSLEDTLDSDAPYLNLFINTGSTAVALMLTIVLLILIYSGNITTLATVSREVWAFSRDKGFPCSSWISHVSFLLHNSPKNTTEATKLINLKKMNRKYDIPFNAVYLSSVGAGILCLINLGSTLAFNIIVSLSLLALLSTYMISIGCVLLRRLRNQPLPHARWSLGRYGIPINAFAFFYSAFVIVWSCFPIALPVGTEDANWAPVVWVAVMALSLLIYVFHGRKHFTPPVMFVEGRRREGTEFQRTD
jgi:choline transport protein